MVPFADAHMAYHAPLYKDGEPDWMMHVGTVPAGGIATKYVDAVAGVVMDRYAMAVELLQKDAPFVAVLAARTVTEVADEATVVATAAGVAAGATVTVPDTGRTVPLATP